MGNGSSISSVTLVWWIDVLDIHEYAVELVVYANDVDTFLTVCGVDNCVTVHRHSLTQDFRIDHIILYARQMEHGGG